MNEKMNFNAIKFLTVSFLLSLAIFIFTFLCTCVYLSPDDFGRQLIANGSMGYTPNPFLYLTSTKIGYVLNKLKSANHELNWYYTYLVFNYLLFSFFQFVVILGKDKLTKKSLLKLSLLLSLSLVAIMRMESTTISILLSTLAFVYGVQYSQEKKLIYFLVALLLFGYAALIRIDVLFVFAFMYGIPLLFLFVKNKSSWAGIIVTCFALLLYFNFWTEQREISANVGFNFNQFVKDTERIIDNPNNLDNANLSNTAFDDNTVELIRNFFFIDPNIFSPDKIHDLAQGIQSTREFKNILWEFYILFQDNRLLLFIFILSVILFQIDRERDLYRGISWLTLFLVCFLIIFMRLPSKISFALFYALIFLRVYFGDLRRGVLPYVGFAMIFIAELIFMFNLQRNNFEKQEAAEKFTSLLSENPELIFQTTRSAQIPFESLTGYQDKLASTKLNFLPFGWVVNTPAYYNHLDFMQINNHFKFLYTDPRVRIMCADEEFVDLLESYGKDVYQIDLTFVRDYSFDNWHIYKIEHQREAIEASF